MKAVVAAFNQEKAPVGAFSVITNLRMELFQALSPSLPCFTRWPRGSYSPQFHSDAYFHRQSKEEAGLETQSAQISGYLLWESREIYFDWMLLDYKFAVLCAASRGRAVAGTVMWAGALVSTQGTINVIAQTSCITPPPPSEVSNTYSISNAQSPLYCAVIASLPTNSCAKGTKMKRT